MAYKNSGAIFGFAACEIGIAAFAVASKFLLYDFLFGYLTVIADSRWLVFLVAFLGLLVPTILMGFSLPLLARAVVSSIRSASKQMRSCPVSTRWVPALVLSRPGSSWSAAWAMRQRLMSRRCSTPWSVWGRYSTPANSGQARARLICL